MYVMYGDEADPEEGRNQKYFLYGGIFIDQSKVWTAHERIDELRRFAGFGAGDSLKFASYTKPAMSLRKNTGTSRKPLSRSPKSLKSPSACT